MQGNKSGCFFLNTDCRCCATILITTCWPCWWVSYKLYTAASVAGNGDDDDGDDDDDDRDGPIRVGETVCRQRERAVDDVRPSLATSRRHDPVGRCNTRRGKPPAYLRHGIVPVTQHTVRPHTPFCFLLRPRFAIFASFPLLHTQLEFLT